MDRCASQPGARRGGFWRRHANSATSDLVIWTLTACGGDELLQSRIGTAYLTEAVESRSGGRITCRCSVTFAAIWPFPPMSQGSRLTSRLAAEEGRDIADTIGDRFMSRFCRIWLGMALVAEGGHRQRASMFSRALLEETHAANERMLTLIGNAGLCSRVCLRREGVGSGRNSASKLIELTASMGGFHEDAIFGTSALAAVFADDCTAAKEAAEASMRCTVPLRVVYVRSFTRDARGIDGDRRSRRRTPMGRRNLAFVPAWFRCHALVTRAYIAIAQGEPNRPARRT